MRYTQFGTTGVSVSRLGFGGMRFENPEKTDEMAEVVWHAFEQGVNYFDTAPGYCGDKSETIIGTAVKEMKKTGKPFVIATKSMAKDAATVRRHCEQSLERLNVDAIDFHHVWCLVHPKDLQERKDGGAFDEFRKLQEEGLIRHMAVSTHLEHNRIAAMLDEGEGLFRGMLIGFSANTYDLRYPGVKAAAERGVGVVTMNTLGGGLLTNHEAHFAAVKQPDDASMVDAAVRFNLSVPGVTVALVGCRNKSDVDEAVRAVDRFKRLGQEQIESVRSAMASAAEDFCTQCGYCRDCPAEVPVVRLMESYNVKMLSGAQAAQNHLLWHWWTPDVAKVVEACTECGACESACTQHLPIIERMKELAADKEAAGKP